MTTPTYGALIAVATEIVVFDENDDRRNERAFQAVRMQVRDELRPHKMELKGWRDHYSLRRRREPKNTENNKLRHRRIKVGTFVDCCREALKIIAPEDFAEKWPKVPRK